MTDNEIKKALECCTTNGSNCKDCPAFVKVDRSNCKKYFRGALDLINRLQAEIERLKAYIQNNGSGWGLISHLEFCKNLKAEAYKEFAERLKESKYESSDWSHGEHPYVVEESDIDNLLYEMVGENDETKII
jgi:hypothetical protein